MGGNTVWGCKIFLKWFISGTEVGNYFVVDGIFTVVVG
jgi:hypothetical protein